MVVGIACIVFDSGRFCVQSLLIRVIRTVAIFETYARSTAIQCNLYMYFSFEKKCGYAISSIRDTSEHSTQLKWLWPSNTFLM